MRKFFFILFFLIFACQLTLSKTAGCQLYRDHRPACPADCTNCEIIDQLKTSTTQIIDQIQDSTESLTDTIETCCAELAALLIEINTSINNIGGGGGNSSCVSVFVQQSSFTPAYTITWPGKYVLCGTITSTATTDLVTITTSNVLFDMNGHSITYVGSTPGVNGFLIQDGLKNVSIVNGSDDNGAIRNVPGAAIKVDSDSANINEQINLANLDLNNNGAAIDLNYTQNVLIRWVKAHSNENGIKIANSSSVKIEDSDLSNNTSSTADVYGLQLVASTTNVLVKNSTMQSNTSSGGDAIGIYADDATGLTCFNCDSSFNNSTNDGSNAAGVWLTGVKKSKVANVTAVSNSSDGDSYGINVEDSIQSTFDSNKVDNNTFGIRDNASKSTNLYVKNIAFSNATNYSVSYGSEGSLLIVTAYPSGLAALNNVGAFANIEIKDTP